MTDLLGMVYYDIFFVEIQFFGKPNQQPYEYYWLTCGRIIQNYSSSMGHDTIINAYKPAHYGEYLTSQTIFGNFINHP